MNSRQKLVQQAFLNREEVVLKRLDALYTQAANDCSAAISQQYAEIQLLTDAINELEPGDPQRVILESRRQAKVYQKTYQEALQKQIGDILATSRNKEFLTVSDYLEGCYDEGYLGAMYDLHGQGIPLVMPIDQQRAVHAVQLESKISQGLYTRIGQNMTVLRRKITAQISRCMVTGTSFHQCAQLLDGASGIGYYNAMRIARTEGHRIQTTAAMDAMMDAKENGCDIVKQWDATLDGNTRESHREVDGEIRELDESFSNGLQYPGDPAGSAAEVIHCRCALLQRARWALDQTELDTLKERAEYFGLDKTKNFEDFKGKYLHAALALNTAATTGEKAVPYSARGIDIGERLNSYLSELKKSGDYIMEAIGSFSYNDLAILTAETGVEFTVLSFGTKSALVRGEELHTVIPLELISMLEQNHGTVDCHSHPFIGDLSPSFSDKKMLELLNWQSESIIIDPTQKAAKYSVAGVNEVFNVSAERSEKYYAELFWGEGD